MKPIELISVRSRPGQSPRLHAWLIWFNRARSANDSAEAIRNLDMIVEDMGAPASMNQKRKSLRYVRNFVSHGIAMEDERVKSFLMAHNIAPPFQYDPSDAQHANFVTSMRGQADAFVKELIEAKLG